MDPESGAGEPALLSVSFRDRDLYYAELDGIASADAFAAKAARADAALARLVHREPVIFYLYGTRLGRAGCLRLARLARDRRASLSKVAFVGARGLDRFFLRAALRSAASASGLPWRLEDDYQAAKEWIVSNRTR